MLVVCYAVSPAAGRTVIISQLPFLATFTANFSYIFSFQRLEAGGIAAWLLPLWSISIEEQFYLFWSVALQRVKAVTSLTVGLVVCCLLLRLALYFVAKVFPEAAPTPYLYYFNTASHADGLLIGALLAQRPQWFAYPALFVVSMVCFWLTPQFDQNVFVVFSFTANAIFFATVIVQLKQWNGIAFLNHLGERSYGMYLWHYPVIVMLGGIASLSLGVTYVVASLSWNLIESKALRLKTLYAS